MTWLLFLSVVLLLDVWVPIHLENQAFLLQILQEIIGHTLLGMLFFVIKRWGPVLALAHLCSVLLFTYKQGVLYVRVLAKILWQISCFFNRHGKFYFLS